MDIVLDKIRHWNCLGEPVQRRNAVYDSHRDEMATYSTSVMYAEPEDVGNAMLG
jgi:hypothetical protein